MPVDLFPFRTIERAKIQAQFFLVFSEIIIVPFSKRYDMTVGETVRIGKSRIKGAGRGVYALTDLKEGQKITKYEGRLVPDDEALTTEEAAYSITHSEGVQLVGYSKRQRWKGIGAAALINDALCPALQSNVKKSAYYTRSQKRRAMNCALQSGRSNDDIYAVALRNIAAGEELYTSYRWDQ